LGQNGGSVRANETDQKRNKKETRNFSALGGEDVTWTEKKMNKWPRNCEQKCLNPKKGRNPCPKVCEKGRPFQPSQKRGGNQPMTLKTKVVKKLSKKKNRVPFKID